MSRGPCFGAADRRCRGSTFRFALLEVQQRMAADDLPYRNLLRAVARLKQSRSPGDVVRVVKALRRWLPDRGRREVAARFRGSGCQIAGRLAPEGSDGRPPPAWLTCWRGSTTRNGWPKSVTGWRVATPPPRSSPVSIPPHHLEVWVQVARDDEDAITDRLSDSASDRTRSR